MNIEIWTDGSCLGNPGPGGWAALMIAKKDGEVIKERMLGGNGRETTNNRMELFAFISALEKLTQPSDVVIYSDSQLTIKCAAREWKRRANHDLWDRFEEAVRDHSVTYEKVKAHVGIDYNERVDAEANRQARLAKGAK